MLNMKNPLTFKVGCGVGLFVGLAVGFCVGCWEMILSGTTEKHNLTEILVYLTFTVGSRVGVIVGNEVGFLDDACA